MKHVKSAFLLTMALLPAVGAMIKHANHHSTIERPPGGEKEGHGQDPAVDAGVGVDGDKAAAYHHKRQQLKAYLEKRRLQMNVKATTVTDSGQIIDWIDPISLLPEGGTLAEPPESPARHLANDEANGDSLFELHQQPHAMGPEGTVPVLRRDTVVQLLTDDQLPNSIEDFLSKYGDKNHIPVHHLKKHGRAHKHNSTRPHNRQLQVPGIQHKYVSATQVVPNFGTQARLNTWDPYVENSAESTLVQGSVVAGATVVQTVECGWHKAVSYGDWKPHLFIYYTTNHFAIYGDYQGGGNLDVAGFVQVSKTIFPGALITSHGRLSRYGGRQYDMNVQFLFDKGNWWIWVFNQFIGYYPGELYRSQPDGLAKGGGTVLWYGELLDITDGRPTRTWMGSGRFANKGYGYAAYIRNIFTYRNDCKCLVNFVPTYTTVDDSNCYSMVSFFNSTSNWGSYFYYGGPGAYNNRKCTKEFH